MDQGVQSQQLINVFKHKDKTVILDEINNILDDADGKQFTIFDNENFLKFTGQEVIELQYHVIQKQKNVPKKNSFDPFQEIFKEKKMFKPKGFWGTLWEVIKN
jgi:hypothetical protein